LAVQFGHPSADQFGSADVMEEYAESPARLKLDLPPCQFLNYSELEFKEAPGLSERRG
jgi:hypothetical protein